MKQLAAISSARLRGKTAILTFGASIISVLSSILFSGLKREGRNEAVLSDNEK